MEKIIKFLLLVIIPALCTMFLAVILWLLALGTVADIIAFLLFFIGIATVYNGGMDV